MSRAVTVDATIAGEAIVAVRRCLRIFPPFIALMVLLPAAVEADDLTQQREQFSQARKHLGAGNITAFRTLADGLKDYPLYPYLRYEYLRPRLAQTKEEEIAGFLDGFSDLPMADDLRRSWLGLLARRGHWETFLRHYTPQSDTILQCYNLQARIRTGNSAYLLEDTRTLWLAGQSQPKECDPAFDLLYKSELMTEDLVWQRIGLAMAQGETGLARYLGRRLPAESSKWAERWIAVHHNPARETRNSAYPDSAIPRRILVHGIHRLARYDVGTAIQRWAELRTRYSFDEEQVASIDREIAVRAALKQHPSARALLDRLGDAHVDEELFHWRVRTALEHQDWDLILRWTRGEAPREEAVRSPWLYWRARALEQTGDPQAAFTAYRLAAAERNYYGFLASDRINEPYAMNHRSLPYNEEEWRKVAELPAIARARELYYLDMLYSARREWYHALQSMTTYQMQIAAMIAAHWGWHDRVILTMGKAESYDDLVLRFPVPYEQKLREYAERRRLDIAWLFALTRAESAFMEDARSPAGALGLMQVMPATGRETARAIGWRNYDTGLLLRADVNIPIGTAYLKNVLERFGDNLVLATAAYNAGPGNVSRWMPGVGCVEPDLWIEQIPFRETRKYVQRILYYSSIYDWRLRRDVIPVQQRMAAVQPPRRDLIVGLSCTADAVSMN